MSFAAAASVLTVRGLAGLAQPSTIQRFRQDGVIVVKGFLSERAEVAQLTKACHAASLARGRNIFPGLDDDVDGRVEFSARMERRGGTGAPPPSASSAAENLPPHVQRRADEVDSTKAMDRRTRRIHLTLKNSKQVDRAYRSLTRTRDRYSALKNVPRHITREEEEAGDISDARLAELQAKYQYDDVKSSFEAYRDSGKMEAEVRRDVHLTEAMSFLQNWSKTWTHVWAEAPPLQETLGLVKGTHATQCVAGSLGARAGEAAAALAGEVVVRLFSDCIQQAVPFTNATPFHFTALGTNYKHPHALTLTIGLARGDPPPCPPTRTVVIPGSHNVLRKLTRDGTDITRFPLNHVFDMGRLLRLTPELGEEAGLAVLPVLEPGDAVFMNDFTMTSSLPGLEGCAASPYVPPQQAPIEVPSAYVLSLLPDRCQFDGERSSWHAKDSHGPLYSFTKGQLLNDERQFPALYRGLDIE